MSLSREEGAEAFYRMARFEEGGSPPKAYYCLCDSSDVLAWRRHPKHSVEERT